MKLEFPSEQFIEDYVWSKLQNEGVCPVTDHITELAFRQKEIYGYGVTDIIKIDLCPSGMIYIKILELKNQPLKPDHIAQLCRYMEGVKRIANRYIRRSKEKLYIDVSGELAGPFDSSRNDVVWLAQNLDNITLFDLSIDVEKGFRSDAIGSGWYRESENLTGYKDEVKQIVDTCAKYRALTEEMFLAIEEQEKQIEREESENGR